MDDSRGALRDMIRDGIVRSIISSKLAPGERLVEMNIAREYGTSQGPVREALRELEMLGFVQSRRHRGTYVRGQWQQGMLDIYGVRAALEEHATRLAAPRLASYLDPLQAEVDAMAAAAAAGDVPGVVAHSERFHCLIIEASGNLLLESLWRGLNITNHTELTLVTLPIELDVIASSHQPIVDAIATGDVERAARASREHQAYFESMLSKQQTATPIPDDHKEAAA